MLCSGHLASPCSPCRCVCVPCSPCSLYYVSSPACLNEPTFFFLHSIAQLVSLQDPSSFCTPTSSPSNPCSRCYCYCYCYCCYCCCCCCSSQQLFISIALSAPTTFCPLTILGPGIFSSRYPCIFKHRIALRRFGNNKPFRCSASSSTDQEDCRGHSPSF